MFIQWWLATDRSNTVRVWPKRTPGSYNHSCPGPTKDQSTGQCQQQLYSNTRHSKFTDHTVTEEGLTHQTPNSRKGFWSSNLVWWTSQQHLAPAAWGSTTSVRRNLSLVLEKAMLCCFLLVWTLRLGQWPRHCSVTVGLTDATLV